MSYIQYCFHFFKHLGFVLAMDFGAFKLNRQALERDRERKQKEESRKNKKRRRESEGEWRGGVAHFIEQKLETPTKSWSKNSFKGQSMGIV